MSDVAEDVAQGVAITKCRNCGTPVLGRFCGECGQNLRDIDRSIWILIREYLNEVLSVEGRLYRTLRLLLLHPGALTYEYLAGRRIRYTSPVRLYLVASAAFFVGFRLARPSDQTNPGYVGAEGGSYYDAVAKVFILLLPALALVLKLAYVRVRRPLVQHLVFSLHMGAAALLWVVALTLLAAAVEGIGRDHTAAPSWLPAFLFWLYIPGQVALFGYVVVALRRTYASSWGGSFLRAVLLASAVAVGFRLLLPIITRLQGEL